MDLAERNYMKSSHPPHCWCPVTWASYHWALNNHAFPIPVTLADRQIPSFSSVIRKLYHLVFSITKSSFTGFTVRWPAALFFLGQYTQLGYISSKYAGVNVHWLKEKPTDTEKTWAAELEPWVRIPPLSTCCVILVMLLTLPSLSLSVLIFPNVQWGQIRPTLQGRR